VVTLRGEVEWFFQAEAAERTVQEVAGVGDVVNVIGVRLATAPDPTEVRRRVTEALERLAALDAASISVTTSDGAVVLRGRVHSAFGRAIAEDAARAAAGTPQVLNEIVVVPA